MYFLRLATSADVIYDVGISTSGEPAIVVLSVGVVVINSVVCILCTFSLVLLLMNVFLYLLARHPDDFYSIQRFLIVY